MTKGQRYFKKLANRTNLQKLNVAKWCFKAKSTVLKSSKRGAKCRKSLAKGQTSKG